MKMRTVGAVLVMSLALLPATASARDETGSAVALMQMVAAMSPKTKLSIAPGETKTVQFGGVGSGLSVGVKVRLTWTTPLLGITHPVEAKLLDGNGRVLLSATHASKLTTGVTTITPASGRPKLVIKNTSALHVLNMDVDLVGSTTN